ncbi:hypothetical protein MCOR25_004048 [Pyricularia grisea]|nr:hypothetical protein MCOR25_004048 [Pyricularia grisea]
MEYHTNPSGTATLTATSETVSAPCQYPSPGTKTQNGQRRAPHALGRSFDRRESDDELNWHLCDSFPGYSGPFGSQAARK